MVKADDCSIHHSVYIGALLRNFPLAGKTGKLEEKTMVFSVSKTDCLKTASPQAK